MGGGRTPAAVVAALVAGAAALAVAASDGERLHFLAVTGDGSTLAAQRADLAVNPASVVKVGTTLWALDRLGPGHRYATGFGWTGSLELESGLLRGDLVVIGGGDPDFQWENAYLVARELNRLGLRRVEGRLVVRGTFWFGWEHGVEKRLVDPGRRGERMGRRLLDALDSARWNSSQANTWEALCERRGWDVSVRPSIRITGGVAVGEGGDATPLVRHRSNPLRVILRRFNVYSNNDIVRVADGLGTVAELEDFLDGRLAADGAGIAVATASGERRNRMSVRHMVALMAALEAETTRHGLGLADLLPVIGCDPGSTRRMFPALAAPPLQATVVCKTGTLTNTDGGVAVLAGAFTGRDGDPVIFAVAAPGAGGRLQHWRQVQQRWLMALIDSCGGAVAMPCPEPLPYSDALAEVESPVVGE